MANSTMLQVKDNSALLNLALKALTRTKVLVGVPADSAPRSSDDAHGASQEITNSELAYIHNFGAPEAGIPQREFMAPGIKNAKKAITAGLKKAALAAIVGDIEKMDQAFVQVGQQAESAIKEKILDGPFVPDKPATIARKGSDRPLIDRMELLRSIKFVIKK